eukprot:242327_1
MAQQAAREYTTCCVCQIDTTEEALYMCTNQSCSTFGEIFCQVCGQQSHRYRSKDHAFEIEQNHIKRVDPSVIEKHINDGLRLVQTTLAQHKIGVIIDAVICGIAGGLLGAHLSRSAFDQFDNEQIGRRQMIMDSLKLFGFSSIEDIENPQIFNAVESKKIYRTLARRYHPERNKGSDESKHKFQEINAALGVLLQLLNTKDKGYVIKRMTQIKAIKWRSDIEELRQLLVERNVMYIVNICTQLDNRVTLEKIASWRKHDILEFIKTLNEDGGNNHEISVIDRNEFADAIAGWNGTANENDHFFRNEPNEDSCDSKDPNDNNEAETATHDATELMNDLLNDIKKHKLLDLVQICQEFDEEYCLESLLEYTKHDILEVINEINADETNDHKISVGRKNKFAKIISNFAAQ